MDGAERVRRLEAVGRACWQMLGVLIIGAAATATVWHLRVVVMPLFAAALLMIVLGPVDRWFERRRLPPGLAALVTLVGFLALVTGVGVLLVPAIVDQVPAMTDRLGDALDRVEDWVDRTRPFGFDGADLRRAVDDASDLGQPSTETIVSGARTVGTTVAGVLLTVVATFFLLRDGRMMRDWAIARLPVEHRSQGDAAWSAVVSALAGYVRGAAVLGTAEGVTIGATIAIVGGDLPALIGTLTFLAAFVPFVGALVAGAVAVAVTLVSAGTTPAIVVGVVALIVQQFDNDVLAPVVYGRFLRIHPLAVLVAIAVGVETAGVIGALAAVPLAASTTAVVRILTRRDQGLSTAMPRGVEDDRTDETGDGPT